MPQKSLAELADKIGAIDFAMLSTKTDGGAIASRPMSNNGDVAYDGDSYYFTEEKARMVGDIERDRRVALSFSGKPSLLGAPGIFIAVEGDAEIIRDKARFKKHWNRDLERWFEKGVETPGLVMLKVHASRIKYWDGEDQGELVLE